VAQLTSALAQARAAEAAVAQQLQAAQGEAQNAIAQVGGCIPSEPREVAAMGLTV
jgi:hypothetical protein